MSITSPSDLKTANITSAINWLETLSATVTDKSDKDIYLCFETDSENGLKAPLSPYELSLAHVALPWKDHRRAESLIYDLEIAWLELFDAIGTRIIDRAILDHVRKSFTALHEAFKTHSLSKPGTKATAKAQATLVNFKEDITNLADKLMTEVHESTQSTASKRHYRTRSAITLDRAALLTGLAKRTIQNLIKDPKNTRFPGLNVEEFVLAGWAATYKQETFLKHWANMKNHPIPISQLPRDIQRKLGFAP